MRASPPHPCAIQGGEMRLCLQCNKPLSPESCHRRRVHEECKSDYQQAQRRAVRLTWTSRLCLHCHQPISRFEHGGLKIHRECKDAYDIDRHKKLLTRHCLECGLPIDPLEHNRRLIHAGCRKEYDKKWHAKYRANAGKRVELSRFLETAKQLAIRGKI